MGSRTRSHSRAGSSGNALKAWQGEGMQGVQLKNGPTPPPSAPRGPDRIAPASPDCIATAPRCRPPRARSPDCAQNVEMATQSKCPLAFPGEARIMNKLLFEGGRRPEDLQGI